MLKMLLDPMGGVVLTNDGNAILREVEVQHPAAKSMIELSRTQDEEVGDGTTSVIILGEYLFKIVVETVLVSLMGLMRGITFIILSSISWRGLSCCPAQLGAKSPSHCDYRWVQPRSSRCPKDH
jgi:hypothetical protein